MQFRILIIDDAVRIRAIVRQEQTLKGNEFPVAVVFGNLILNQPHL